MKPFLRANELAALTVKWLYHLTDDWGSANTTPSMDSPKSTHNTSGWGGGEVIMDLQRALIMELQTKGKVRGPKPDLPVKHIHP